MEIEHLQLLLGRTRTRVQQDFQQWWSQQVTHTHTRMDAHTDTHTLARYSGGGGAGSRFLFLLYLIESRPTLKNKKKQWQPLNFSGEVAYVSPSAGSPIRGRVGQKNHATVLCWLQVRLSDQDKGNPG